MSIALSGAPLSLEQVVAVARDRAPVVLTEVARQRLRASNAAMHAAMASGDALYGINTGFGSLAQQRIPAHQVQQVQTNLIRSHAAGVDEALPHDVVRAMVLVLAASLSRGFSGVREEVVEQLLGLLKHDVVPVVPSVGSVGASGDLAPLAHLALVLIGEGEAWVGGQRLPGDQALAAVGMVPLVLGPKEGLALINGTHLMTALAVLALADAEHLVHAALAAAALSIDACRGTDAFLDARVHEVRGQRGQIEVARRLEALIAGSTILPSHLHDDPRVQDPYSLRCTPQVLGAAIDALHYAHDVVERELGAVTDNPLVFADEAGRTIVSAGNFHGMPLAIALDTAAIALCHVAGISERRVYFLLSASDDNNPLNPHLSPQPGLHSGLMITQYTAASCVNELATLATPASVHNIPTSAGIEDYNSMGATSARQLKRAVMLAATVVAIELICSAEALEYQRPLRSGAGVEAAYDLVRTEVPRLLADRPPSPDISAVRRLVLQGSFDEIARTPRKKGLA